MHQLLMQNLIFMYGTTSKKYPAKEFKIHVVSKKLDNLKINSIKILFLETFFIKIHTIK